MTDNANRPEQESEAEADQTKQAEAEQIDAWLAAVIEKQDPEEMAVVRKLLCRGILYTNDNHRDAIQHDRKLREMLGHAALSAAFAPMPTEPPPLLTGRQFIYALSAAVVLSVALPLLLGT